MASNDRNGSGVGPQEVFCTSCGSVIHERAEICPECGVRQLSEVYNKNNAVNSSESKRTPSNQSQNQPREVLVQRAGEGQRSKRTSSYGNNNQWGEMVSKPPIQERIRSRVRLGLISGMVAYAASFILTTIIAIPVAVSSITSGNFELRSEATATIGGGAIVSALKSSLGGAMMNVIGWVFYNTHFVPLRASASSDVAGRSAELTVNFVTSQGGSWMILTIIPPVVLFLGGRNVVSNTDTFDQKDSVLAGAMLVVGYLPLALIGSLFFQTGINGETIGTVSISPIFQQTILFAGVGYPVLFGGLGGYFGNTI